MQKFRYQAITDSGSPVSGVIEADSTELALDMLVSKGLLPSEVRPAGASLSLNFKAIDEMLATVKPGDLILFTKQFRTMVNAGLSILNVLDVLEQQTENPKLKKAVIAISQDIRQGTTIYEAFSKHPRIFDNLYCSMLRAGEVSGNLSEVLERLIYIIQHEFEIKQQIKSALTYPAIVVTALFGAFIFLLTFVIPKFMGIFASAKIELPMPTRVCIFLYDGLNNYWPLIVGGVVLGVTALVMYCRTPQGRLVRDKFLLRCPLIGKVMLKAAMSRFAAIFALLQSSGVSVINSVSVLAQTIGNAAIERVFENLKDQLQEGKGISRPLKSSPFFTPLIITMIAIGEESGNLDEMLREVASHYDYEVEYSVKKMAEMIGPILILVLAGVVGFFALAIFLPMWDLTKMAG
ncbi:type IV pilus assembly protein PilC [Desulfobaculum xiamenense]|uniref:Type IV pilus assembly protein PilC n=1 Tax=Desulfobaculum xiamenense TaxID=995050 RepID=A0A846QNH3_9BACT|nr:type II secretion system F family protein [Desulfobaculum xiamenense]NJB68570.1 type IV pilus assembly protein PilC [Desulfobaculum xiamenense]